MKRSRALAVGVTFVATLVAACESKGKNEAEFCSVVAKVASEQQQIVTILNSGEVPIPAEVKTALTNFRDALDEMADGSPEAIADDMVLVVNGFTAFDLGLQKVDYDYGRLFSDPEAAEAAQADMAAMDSPETQAAMDVVDEFSLAECGIALDTSGA
jgi:hypothetical protein